MSDYLRCPECKGRCCRDHYGYRIKHMDAEFYEHTCDACYDGSKRDELTLQEFHQPGEEAGNPVDR